MQLEQVEEVWKRLKPLPWKHFSVIVAASFLVASAVSVLVAMLFVPGGTDLKPSEGGDRVAIHPVITDGGLVSLKKADIDAILQRNLFNSEGKLGDIDESSPSAGPADPNSAAAKSDLPLKLLGIIYGGTPSNGMATVENTAKNRINSFVVGDVLLKDVKLLEIHRQRIILDNNSRREYLLIEQTELKRTKRGKQAAPTPVSTGTDGIAPIATKPPPEAFKEEGFERKGGDISMTTSYKDKLLGAEFTKVLQDAKASPHVVDGQLKGFVLTRIREGSIYEKSGLQNGDVVQEINGHPLNDTSGAIKLLQSLRNETEVEINITRGGANKTLTLKVM